jgi:hypothetical protein
MVKASTITEASITEPKTADTKHDEEDTLLGLASVCFVVLLEERDEHYYGHASALIGQLSEG